MANKLDEQITLREALKFAFTAESIAETVMLGETENGLADRLDAVQEFFDLDNDNMRNAVTEFFRDLLD